MGIVQVRRGVVTSFVAKHQLPWELTMAALTLVYVSLSLVVDQGGSALLDDAVGGLALIFLVEFTARFLDAPGRMGYLREHWIDLITCLPAIGPLRALRLLRLLGLLRLANRIRLVAYVRSASNGEGSLTWIVWPTALLLWFGAADGLWTVEKGHNPGVQTFGDALYMAFITVTTVGYGDVRPVTPEGKVIAGALVFLGLGLLGFISAQLTSRWLRVENRENVIEAQLAGIRHELVALRELVASGSQSNQVDAEVEELGAGGTQR